MVGEHGLGRDGEVAAAALDAEDLVVDLAVDLGADHEDEGVEVEEEEEDGDTADGAVGAVVAVLAEVVDVPAERKAEEDPDADAEDRAGEKMCHFCFTLMP